MCVFVFLTICIDHETFSRIIHRLPKQNSSQSGFMNTIMNSVFSDNVQSPALNPVVDLWYVVEWDSQHECGGIVWSCESQWNVSNISWNPCNPLRLFLEQMEALPCINSVPNEVLSECMCLHSSWQQGAHTPPISPSHCSPANTVTIFHTQKPNPAYSYNSPIK